MNAIWLSVNFDFFMENPLIRPGDDKLEFSSSKRSKKPGAGQFCRFCRGEDAATSNDFCFNF